MINFAIVFDHVNGVNICPLEIQYPGFQVLIVTCGMYFKRVIPILMSPKMYRKSSGWSGSFFKREDTRVPITPTNVALITLLHVRDTTWLPRSNMTIWTRKAVPHRQECKAKTTSFSLHEQSVLVFR